MRSVTISALKVMQPIGSYFIGVMEFDDLVQISYADVRKMEDDDVGRYLGIQRPLDPKRVTEIRGYVQVLDATFPTSVILAVEPEAAEWDETTMQLTLSEVPLDDGSGLKIRFEKIAKILDGQHRVAGLQTFTGTVFQVPVAIFIGADVAEQASIFSIVNLAQTKVNRSLVFDLFDLSKSRSPQKTCHNVAVALDESPNSPLNHRIKRLGVATRGRFDETITQATMVDSLMPYVSKTPNEDRDALLRNRKLVKSDYSEAKKLIFRNLFISGEDGDIAKIVWSYFAAVRDRWPDTWSDLSRGNILPKTNGVRALMRFLRPAYLNSAENIGDIVPEQKFEAIFSRIQLEREDFNITNFPPGTSGESNLVKKLLHDSGLDGT
jgi:DGQHR domain-containing protein